HRRLLCLQVPARDVEGDATDPGGERAFEAVLAELLVHPEKHVLAKLAGVLGVLDHAVDHVPDQLLVARDEALEGPRGPRQYRLHQFLVLAHAPLDTSSGPAVAPYALRRGGAKYL